MAEACVVVPFRGRWETVVPTLTALAHQTVRDDLEIILSVDGLDEPPETVSSLVDSVVTGDQAGPATARNRGWRSSEAPLVLFTDGDCIPHQNWAAEMIGGLRGEYQAVKGIYSSGGGKLIQRLAQVEFQERYRIMSRRAAILLADTYSAGFHRSWLEKLDGFDENYPLPEHEDVDLSWRLTSEGGKIGYLPDAKVRHLHRDTWSGYFKMKMRRGKWRMMLIREYPEKAVSDGYTPQGLKLQILLAPLLAAAVPMCLINPAVTAGAGALFLVSSVPLAAAAMKNDRGLVPVIPFFAYWRAAALFAGSLAGIISRRNKCLHR